MPNGAARPLVELYQMNASEKTRIVIELPAELVAGLDRASGNMGITRKALLLRIVRHYLASDAKELGPLCPPDGIWLLRPRDRAIAEQREQLVRQWQAQLAKAENRSKDRITAAFVRRVNLYFCQPLCRATLYRWRRLYARGGAVALADRRLLKRPVKPK